MRKKHVKIPISIAALLLFLSACSSDPTKDEHTRKGNTMKKLPYYGEYDIALIQDSAGNKLVDTLYYTIPKFSFTNQSGETVSHKTYEGKIFVAEFFFTECTSICPIISSQMARLQSLVKKEGLEKEVWFLSHTVKPETDTPEVLKNYGDQLGADYSNWNFVTGRSSDIYELAQDGYMLTAFPSDTAQGGVFHTDKLALIDRSFHIRGYYDGTSTTSVDQLFEDLKKLVHEKNN